MIICDCSGDLDAPVPAFPPFPGTERNLLRALIGMYVINSLIQSWSTYALGQPYAVTHLNLHLLIH